MRTGIFGGSFDPIHHGHLLLAECCSKQAKLDGVWFMPAAKQPHKPSGAVASEEQRVEMLRLALLDRPGWITTMVEIERGSVSYTVDSLRELSKAYPEREWFLLMGADTLHDFSNWREPQTILQMATPLVVHRAGEPPADFTVLADLVNAGRLQAIAAQQVDMPATEISSSEIRRRVAAGEAIREMVPDAVAEFIRSENIYRA